jgi:hypothetical protein
MGEESARESAPLDYAKSPITMLKAYSGSGCAVSIGSGVAISTVLI